MPDMKKLENFLKRLDPVIQSNLEGEIMPDMFIEGAGGKPDGLCPVPPALKDRGLRLYSVVEGHDDRYKNVKDVLMSFLGKNRSDYQELIDALEECFKIYPYDEVSSMDRKRPKEQLQKLDKSEKLENSFYSTGYPNVIAALASLFEGKKFEDSEKMFMSLVIYVLYLQRCVLGSNLLGYEQFKQIEKHEQMMRKIKEKREKMEKKREEEQLAKKRKRKE